MQSHEVRGMSYANCIAKQWRFYCCVGNTQTKKLSFFRIKLTIFFYLYVEKSGAGKEGITNYLHMLGSAHIIYYMQIHRNLYKYSQQGWESMNEKFKLIFFNHTQRGGNFGKNSEETERSYLKSIYWAFQREVLWISRVAEDHFLSKYNSA
jgi:hypothetical protein